MNSAQFGPKDTYVATSSDDNTARLWNVESGTPAAVLEGHAGSVTIATFKQGGDALVTASDDGTVRVWRVFPSQQALQRFASNVAPRELTDGEREAYFLK